MQWVDANDIAAEINVYSLVLSNLDINGNILGAGGGASSSGSCESNRGHQGNGGTVRINEPNYNITVLTPIRLDWGGPAYCADGNGGTLNLTASVLNITRDLTAVGNISGEINLIADTLYVNSTCNNSRNSRNR